MTERQGETRSKGLLDTLSEAAAGPLTNLVAGRPPVAHDRLLGPSFGRFDALVWSLHRMARNAIGAEIEREALVRLSGTRRWTRGAQEAFVVWVELIERLVQRAEHRHPGAGKGAVKAAEVRRAVAELQVPSGATIADGDGSTAAPDDFLEWTIDALVLLLDSYSLWNPPEAEAEADPVPRLGLARRAAKRLIVAPAVAMRALANGFARVAQRLERASGQPPLYVTPRRGESLIWAERELAALRDSTRWFSAHRRELVGALELVFSAVRLASLRRDFDREMREVYASDLVVTALREMGLEDGLGEVFGIVAFLADWLVAATARVFEKHDAIPPPPERPRPRPRRAMARSAPRRRRRRLPA